MFGLFKKGKILHSSETEDARGEKKRAPLMYLEEDETHYKGRVLDSKFEESTLSEEEDVLEFVTIPIKDRKDSILSRILKFGGSGKIPKDAEIKVGDTTVDEDYMRDTYGDTITNLAFKKGKRI